MSVKLQFLYLLLVALHLSEANNQCHRFQKSCDSCIKAGSECAWCTDSDIDIRCLNLEETRRGGGCSKEYIYNPQGSVHIVKNDSTNPEEIKTLFLQPQEVSLHLRPGKRQSFSLTMSMPTDHPATDLTMDTSFVPKGVNITFSMAKGNPALVQVNVKATKCPRKNDSSHQNQTGPWSVLITPRGFSSSVKLDINLLCECNCSKGVETNSPACSGHGDLICGHCNCHMPYIGKHCQKNPTSSEDETTCQRGPNAPVCSGRGVCVEGSCECLKRENPSEVYSGTYCECSNFDCPHFEGRPCGSRGRCECGRCVCEHNWTGESCSCSLDTASCMATNQMLCSGRGVCECGSCKCNHMYHGPTCEHCPTCTNTCEQHEACVACQAFRKGPKMNTCEADCGHVTVTMMEATDDLQEETESENLCKMQNYGMCYFYTIPKPSSGGGPFVSRVKRC